MNTLDLNTEIENVLSYYIHLASKQDTLGKELESLTKDIIKNNKDGVDLNEDDFVELEEKSFMINLCQQEKVKSASSLKTLYRISLSMGHKVDIQDSWKKIFDSIISNRDYDFMMYVDKTIDDVGFKDESIKAGIRNMCEYRVGASPIEDRFNMLKTQYESYLELTNNSHNRNGNEGEETVS